VNAASPVNTTQAWDSAQKQYADMQQRQARAQAEAYAAVEKRGQEAYRTYAAEMGNLVEALRSRYREAGVGYVARVQEAMEAGDASKADQARTVFEQTTTSLADELRTKTQQLQADFIASADSLAKDYQSLARDSYRETLEAQRKFWTNLDIDSLVPRH
jgi:hypothetical protein